MAITSFFRENFPTKLGIDSNSIKFIKPIWKRSHYRATINWLTKYFVTEESSNLQKVSGYLEAFYHLCVVEDWEKAGEILRTRLDTPTKEELHHQLHTWGYYHQQIGLYISLLGKLSSICDYICLANMANAYDVLGKREKANEYRRQHLQLARNNDDQREASLALVNLGINYPFSGALILYAFDILSIIKSNRRSWVHVRAVENWLTKFQPTSDATNLEIMKGLLESFHHLCELGEWQIASQILRMRLNLNVNEELHNQLYLWGYYRHLISIYNQILGKLNNKLDTILLIGLGSIYNTIGELHQAIDYLVQGLDICQKIGDIRSEASILSQLGTSYRTLGVDDKALDFYEQSLDKARTISDKIREGVSIGEIGITYCLLAKHNQALNYLNRSLSINREIGSKIGQLTPLYGLSINYLRQGIYDQALLFNQQHLSIAHEIGYKHSEGNGLRILGQIQTQSGCYSEAIEYLQVALNIFNETGNRYGKLISCTWKSEC